MKSLDNYGQWTIPSLYQTRSIQRWSAVVRVLKSRQRGFGFKPHRQHGIHDCVLGQDTLIPA